MGLANVGKKLLGGMGRGLTSRSGLAAVGIGAFGLGMLNKAAPAARDAAFDVAFDDPNADVAFMGRKMSSRFLLGTAMGGPLGAGLRMSAPSDYMMVNPMVPQGPVNADGSFRAGGIGAGVGGLVGGIAGRVLGGKGSRKGIAIGASVGAFLGGTGGLGSIRGAAVTTAGGGIAGAVAGGIKGFKSGSAVKGLAGIGLGAIGGTAAGALVGGTMVAGSIAPTALGAKAYINENQTFFDQSPYAGRTSSSIASSLSASGDIVLGMHNSRRGY